MATARRPFPELGFAWRALRQEAQIEAAVVRPLMFRPSFMITPAPRKPTPVTMPCTTRVGSTGTEEGAPWPPYQKPG
jgi:hypothetical protein